MTDIIRFPNVDQAVQPDAAPSEPDSATSDQRTEAAPPPDPDGSFPIRLMVAMQEALGAHGIPFDADMLRADFGLPPMAASGPEDEAAPFGQRQNAGEVPAEMA